MAVKAVATAVNGMVHPTSACGFKRRQLDVRTGLTSEARGIGVVGNADTR
jgi:hypothetical protein